MDGETPAFDSNTEKFVDGMDSLFSPEVEPAMIKNMGIDRLQNNATVRGITGKLQEEIGANEQPESERKDAKMQEEEEISHGVWKKRGQMTWCALTGVVALSLIPWLIDIATDLKVAADHYLEGDKVWFSLSLLLVLVPLMLTQFVSFLFHKHEEKWPILHVFQLGVLKRYVDLFRTGYYIKLFKNTKDIPATFYKSVVSQRNDIAIIGLFTAFLEDAPQLVLQLYILVSRGQFDPSSLRDIWVAISTCISLALFSKSLMNYATWLRATEEEAGEIDWYSAIAIMGWRLCMLVARMVAMVLFASVFKAWLILLMIVHGVVMFILFGRQPMKLFPESPSKRVFIRAVVAYMSVFCYFSIEGKQTRVWVIIFYTIVFVENSSMFALGYYYSGFHGDWGKILLSIEWVSFVAGVLFMVLYYGWLHPNHIKPKNSSPAPNKNATDSGIELVKASAYVTAV